MEKDKRDCVADASSLIALTRGEAIDCLGEIFRTVYIPKAVQEECRDLKTAAAIQKRLCPPLIEGRTSKTEP